MVSNLVYTSTHDGLWTMKRHTQRYLSLVDSPKAAYDSHPPAMALVLYVSRLPGRPPKLPSSRLAQTPAKSCGAETCATLQAVNEQTVSIDEERWENKRNLPQLFQVLLASNEGIVSVSEQSR